MFAAERLRVIHVIAGSAGVGRLTVALNLGAALAKAGRETLLIDVIENCRRLHLDAYTYLREVLTRLPHMTNRQIKDVTPKAWAAAQKQRLPLKAAS